jgi:hypothetical protein
MKNRKEKKDYETYDICFINSVHSGIDLTGGGMPRGYGFPGHR